MTIVPAYTGPQCPRCGVTLTADWIRSGAITCPYCSRAFEATAFTPPPRKQAITAEVVTVGPEGASSCANHARNAATAACQRCGLLICALCDMNVGAGSYCPACFERVRSEGTLQAAARRYRDYALMGRTSALVGLLFSFLFLGLPFGVMAVYCSVKARKQLREQGRSLAGATVVMIFGILEIVGGIAAIGFLIYSVAESA
jgi:uncharacterized paraquat-inducible protein A